METASILSSDFVIPPGDKNNPYHYVQDPSQRDIGFDLVPEEGDTDTGIIIAFEGLTTSQAHEMANALGGVYAEGFQSNLEFDHTLIFPLEKLDEVKTYASLHRFNPRAILGIGDLEEMTAYTDGDGEEEEEEEDYDDEDEDEDEDEDVGEEDEDEDDE